MAAPQGPNLGLTKPGIRPIRKDEENPSAKRPPGRVKRQKDGDSQPKAKAKAKAKASSGGVGDWTLFAELPHVGELELDSDSELVESVVPFKRLRGSKFSFVPGKDEMGEDLPKDDMSPYTIKQTYVMQKVIDGDADEKREYDEAVATRDKAVVRAFVNSLIPKSATYAWAVTGDLSSSTTEHTVQFEEKVWGVCQNIIRPSYT